MNVLCVSPRLLQSICPNNKKRALSTKEETLLQIILFFGHSIPPIPTRDSDHVPPFPSWTATHFTVFPFISDSTGNSTVRLQSASNRLSSLPPSDIKVWTVGSVPSLFGPGGAGVYVTCSKCNTSYFLSFSTGPIASSFTAVTFALKKGLDWCTSHFMVCKFQSVLFLIPNRPSQSFHQPPLIYGLSSSGMFGPSPPTSPTTPPCASNGSPVTLIFPVMKMRIYLPKLVPPCLMTQSHALSP